MNYKQRGLFEAKIEKTKECWIWKGAVTKYGYGTMSFNTKGERRKTFAHRVSYELVRGSVITGMVLDHLCRVRNCVNPFHLEEVTSRENIIRGNGVAGINARKTHCKWGHELTGENVFTFTQTKKGKYTSVVRKCRVCDARRAQAVRKKRASL